MAEAKACSEWPVLSEDAIAEQTQSVPAWSVFKDGDVQKLERVFVCANFQAALDFIAGAGAVAEQRNHHPDLSIFGYRNVKVSVYTHSLAGLTENDFDLVRAIDNDVKIKYSPKFLKDHPEAQYTAAVASVAAAAAGV